MPAPRRRSLAAKALFFDSRRWRAAETSRRRVRRDGAAGALANLAREAPFIASDRYRTSTGERIVHAQQYLRGLRVFGSTRVVRTRRGSTRATPPLFRLPRTLDLQPLTDPEDAVAVAVTFLKARGALPARVAARPVFAYRTAHLADEPSVVLLPYGFAEPIDLHLEVFPQPYATASLTWVLRLVLTSGRRFQAVVTAGRPTPRVLRMAEINTDAFTATWAPAPGQSRTDTFPRPPIATPGGGQGTASQWQVPGSGGMAKGPNGACLQASPVKALPLGPLKVDNAFVWCNLLHDLFAAFGFDASNGAFEVKDPVRIMQYSTANEAGATFENYVDGHDPFIHMFDSPHPGGAHAATDPTILIHEYAHGVSQRLVGGRTLAEPFTTVEAQGFSEGLSDFFALTIVNYVLRNGSGVGAVTAIGEAFTPGGFRQYAGFAGTWPTSPKEKYRIGKVWCAAMLDARTAIVVLAASSAENLADRFLWQVCIDALKAMAPLSHATLTLTLQHARDAFVGAATALEGAWALPGAGTVLKTAMSNRGI
jgi:hypothetical protein